MFAINGCQPTRPIILTACLNDKPVETELDTGATMTVMPQGKFNSILQVLSLHTQR